MKPMRDLTSQRSPPSPSASLPRVRRRAPERATRSRSPTCVSSTAVRVIPDATVVCAQRPHPRREPAPRRAAQPAEIDGSGRTLMPSIIDSHGHARERRLAERAAQFGITPSWTCSRSIRSPPRCRRAAADEARDRRTSSAPSTPRPWRRATPTTSPRRSRPPPWTARRRPTSSCRSVSPRAPTTSRSSSTDGELFGLARHRCRCSAGDGAGARPRRAPPRPALRGPCHRAALRPAGGRGRRRRPGPRLP